MKGGNRNGVQNEAAGEAIDAAKEAADGAAEEKGGKGLADSAGEEGDNKPASDGTGADFEAALAERDARIAERDEKIAELEAQVAEAAKTAEATEDLKSQIEQLKKQSEEDQVEFALKLVGCRNIKAARAVLDDYEGDVDALKEAEPWLFAQHAAADAQGGKTGLPNAGAATDEGKQVKKWREIAGLPPKKN